LKGEYLQSLRSIDDKRIDFVMCDSPEGLLDLLKACLNRSQFSLDLLTMIFLMGSGSFLTRVGMAGVYVCC